MRGYGPCLLGRNWMQHIPLDWKQVGSVSCEKSNKTVDQLLAKCEDVFDEGLGTIQPFAAKLSVRSDATPKFCKARPVPYALLDEQLDKLEAKRILEKVNHSEWAAPTVAVPKKDGTTRICGDYKVTINSMWRLISVPPSKAGRPFCHARQWEEIHDPRFITCIQPT